MIDEDQRTYVQWAEEKLSLANIAADLLIQHRTAVDKDVGALLAELKVCQPSRCAWPLTSARSSCTNYVRVNNGGQHRGQHGDLSAKGTRSGQRSHGALC